MKKIRTNHERFADAFKSRKGGEFSTAQIRKIMVDTYGADIKEGSILPNDHGSGNRSDCSCVGTAGQVFDRLGRARYRVL